MLKKVIIGILCLVILAATGGGIYLYTLDWNKHKALVAQRFSQITGLQALIDGNLRVDLFPTPKFSASKVKFFKNKGSRDPLVVVNDITATVELMPLLDNKFIINSMSLTQATVYIDIDEKGELNWKDVGQNSNNKSGNVEVSFHDIRLTNSTISYKNKKENEEAEFPSISANINAPSLKGPYKTDGKFIHNNSEIRFKGDIVKDKSIALKMAFNNAASATSFTIDGTLGNKAQGNITFETQSLLDISNVLFGEASISENYDQPLYLSFKYDYAAGNAKLDNFTTRYGQNTAGSGTVIIKNDAEGKDINADFDMAKFDLKILEDLGSDIVKYAQSGKKLGESDLAQYSAAFTIKAGNARFRDAEAQNLSLNLTFKDGILDVTRFGIIMPGETIFKTVGRINLNDNLEYIFNQAVESKDLRTFASVFGLDLTKLTAPENKKSVFKKAQADIKINGNLESLKISVSKATIDTTTLKGNIGWVKKDQSTMVLIDADASKTIFDRYIQPLPADLKNASLQDKFVYQMKLIPWSRDLIIDADINIASAVYNQVPMEKIHLQFVSEQEKLAVSKLSIDNIAGARLNLALEADKIFSVPYFNELSYDVKTDNFPLFASTLGIDTGDKSLFKRKLFAAQGAMSGTMAEYSLSSIQKFGDTEFSYTGAVANNADTGTAVNGDLELKTNNFSDFIKGLNLDYSPDMPVTTFTLAGKLRGTARVFELNDLNAYLGANNIKGKLKFDNSAAKPKLAGDFAFDKFEADRWFNLSKKATAVEPADTSFIREPALKEKKIDYSPLAKIDFDIKAAAKQLFFDNNIYTNAQTETKLKGGILDVAHFTAEQDKSNINFRFVLDSNGIPKIDGYFNLKKFKTPALGGTTYTLESGWLDAEGTFNSAAGSKKEFMDSLNAKGKFSLANTAMQGWDLDLIKFELEQRKNLKGFEESVLKNLKTGRSSFTRIRGSYNISKGLVVADSVIWESPVVNMNMQFNLNLSDWLFSAVFNAVYHNASFSDIFKFTFDGNLANPDVKTDLSESIERISKLEDRVQNAQKYQEKEKMERIGAKIKTQQRAIDAALTDINRMALDVVRYKPATANENVVNIYESNLKTINDTEINVRKMQDTLNNYPDEEALMNLEAELASERAKLQFIPKILEENYVVDSKYIFDDTFNKIAWLYNLAQNNSAYHTSLTDVYMAQVEILKTSENPIPEEKTTELKAGIDKAKQDMEHISTLHAKIRDNYLTIIDAVKISEMRENNEIANQALKTMLTYAKQLNNDIIANIDVFRAVLGINARDYDEFIVYPPENIEDIDVTKPTVNTEGKRRSVSAEVVTPQQTESADEAKKAEENATPIAPDSKETEKKDALELSSEKPVDGLAGLLAKLQQNLIAKKGTEVAANPEFNGLSDILKSNIKDTTSVLAANNDLNKSEMPILSKSATLDKTLESKPLEAIMAVAAAEPDGKLSTVQKEAEPDSQTVSAEAAPMAADTIVLAEKADASLHKAAAEENILSKTKAAIAEIMAKIKSTEQNLETIIVKKEDTVPAALTAAADLDAIKAAIPEATPEKPAASTLKVNPVVAMDIGKETMASIEPDLKSNLHKRQGFAVKKTPAAAEADKPSLNTAPTIIAAAQNSPANLLNSARPELNKRVLLQLFAEDNAFSLQKPANDITNDAMVYADSSKINEKQAAEHTYLFPITGQRTPPLSGIAGKSMLADKVSSGNNVQEHKYLFAANTLRPGNFSGEVGKRASLAVK